MYWGHFPPFGFFFFLLLIGMFVTTLIIWKRSYKRDDHSVDHAVRILDRRLASGDITIDQYNEILTILKKDK
ncbi:hypothetical protein SAMN05421743_101278 [Thalassobacillus cyri]|uniref:Short C-terminal domain-containing protein n=1 Tax=Thalassobacillus cyri TaxID=571932 RepID=A0A1H3W175_9BACI|nr:hypothetical protein [Thalassobacillus cyri]SDZ80789.1 hypothetical protein SAMN05421743_101278 [Thalassobacillus cyri]